MIREKVKNLWKLCFNDSEEFTELYFRLRYNNDINIAIQSGEEVIAALQMLPYPMTFEGEDIHTAYISGACTHPDYRNRGVMHELLSQAFARMLHNNVALSTLIPAEPWLFDYYGRSGYAPVFRYAEETFIASGTPTADTGLTLEMSAEYTEKRYEYLDRKLRERPCCIQHTEEDFQVIIADLQLGQGFVCTLSNGEEITALAITYPIGKANWRIGEIVSDTPATKTKTKNTKTSGFSLLPLPVKANFWVWHASSMPKPCCNSMLRPIRNWNSAFISPMSRSVPITATTT